MTHMHMPRVQVHQKNKCCRATCKVVGLVCNVGLLSITLGPSFLDKGVGTGPTETHLSSACAQTTLHLPGFGYMPITSKAAIKKLWRADTI